VFFNYARLVILISNIVPLIMEFTQLRSDVSHHSNSLVTGNVSVTTLSVNSLIKETASFVADLSSP
jgi:hypothetical protein